MTKYFTDMSSFFHEKKGSVLRYWVHDQRTDTFEPDIATDGILEECVELANGDYLLGFQLPESEEKIISYYKFSEISIMYCESDQE